MAAQPKEQQNDNQTGDRKALTIPVRLPFPQQALDLFGVDRISWRALTEAIFPSALTPEAVLLALSYCKARGLDPYKKQCHIVPVWDSKKRAYVETVWPGIAELRTTASRTGVYAGCDEAVFGPVITTHFKDKVRDGKDGWKTIEATVTYPEWIQITVYKIVQGIRCPFPGPKTRYTELMAGEKGSKVPNARWQKAPFGQLEKCYDPDTEVLTDRGFQKFMEVSGRILQVTQAGLEPTDVAPFRQAYSGPMVVSEGQALNFAVTPNHDMVTTTGKMEALELLARASAFPKDRIPLCAPGRADSAPISDESIILAAAFMADGWVRPRGRFEIALSRSPKIEMLDAVGLHLARHDVPCAGQVAVAGSRRIVTRFDKVRFTYKWSLVADLCTPEKSFIPDALLSLSQRQARLLVDSLVSFDGALMENGVRRFYTSSADIAAGFELAAVLAGYAVSPRRPRVSDISTKPNYCITISSKAEAPVLGRSSNAEVVTLADSNPSGEVWCCRVPSGVIVVRRHGLSMLCGNCAEAAALRKAFPEEIGDVGIAEDAHMFADGEVIDGEFQRAAEPEPKPTRESVKQVEERKSLDVVGEQLAATQSKQPATGNNDRPQASKDDDSHRSSDAAADETSQDAARQEAAASQSDDWEAWLISIREGLMNATNVPDLNSFWANQRADRDIAPDEVREQATEWFNARMAALKAE